MRDVVKRLGRRWLIPHDEGFDDAFENRMLVVHGCGLSDQRMFSQSRFDFLERDFKSSDTDLIVAAAGHRKKAVLIDVNKVLRI